MAPLIFDWTYEHLLLLAAAAWLMCSRARSSGWCACGTETELARGLRLWALSSSRSCRSRARSVRPRPLGAFNRIAGVVPRDLAIAYWDMLHLLGRRAAHGPAAGSGSKERHTRSPCSFFSGIYSIRPGANNSRVLVHGTTVHGVQNLGSPERERMKTSYYVPLSGVGLAMDAAPTLFGPGSRVTDERSSAEANDRVLRPGTEQRRRGVHRQADARQRHIIARFHPLAFRRAEVLDAMDSGPMDEAPANLFAPGPDGIDPEEAAGHLAWYRDNSNFAGQAARGHEAARRPKQVNKYPVANGEDRDRKDGEPGDGVLNGAREEGRTNTPVPANRQGAATRDNNADKRKSAPASSSPSHKRYHPLETGCDCTSAKLRPRAGRRCS